MSCRRLEGRSALVTGAGAGIGQASALALAAEGAIVAATDLDRARAEETLAKIEAAGGQGRVYSLDVTDRAAIADTVPTIIRELGGVDVLVNNAGGTLTTYGTILDLDPDYWDRIMDLNLRSTFLMCRTVLPTMLAQQRGAIVNIASVGALISGKGFTIYGTAKAAIVRLTQGIAADFADQGIRANVVCPGTIGTQAIERMFATDPNPEAARARWTTGIPMRRLGRPEEIARVVAFLASDDSSFMTGTTQVVDGGSVLI